MNRMPNPRFVLSLMTLAILIGTVGCAGPRRVEATETTRPEINDRRQLPVTLIEFREAAVPDLLQELPEMREVAETDGPVTVLLGDINNTTGVTNTSDYEYVMSGIRSDLIRTRAARNKLRFVEKRVRVENLAVQERVATQPGAGAGTGEDIRWGGGSYYVPDYEASKTYGLFMDVFRVGRGNTGLYRIELQVVSLATNNILYSFSQEVKQVSK